MKYGIELNGVANITLLLSTVEENMGFDYAFENGVKAIENIKEQLVSLERYMIAYCDAVNKGEQPPPYWHEILANPNQYPTNAEITKSGRTYVR